MTARENFVSRWARLKRDADVARATEPAADPRPLAAGAPRGEGSADQPFDPASLPSIESITASSDISGFLRSGVPAELARAALRRVWASDPAIRDFVGIAENQWDFNDPNAIQGFGALPGGENSPNLLAQALGNHERLAGMIAETPTLAAPSLPAATDRKPVALDQNAPQASGVPPPIENASHSPDAANTRGAEADVSPRPRSHGGALPR
jgi:hypothetical protein